MRRTWPESQRLSAQQAAEPQPAWMGSRCLSWWAPTTLTLTELRVLFCGSAYILILYSSIFLYRVRRLMPRMEAVLTLLPPVTFKTCVR